MFVATAIILYTFSRDPMKEIWLSKQKRQRRSRDHWVEDMFFSST